MRNKSREDLIKLAAANKEKDQYARAVADCTEGDFVSPKLLKLALETVAYEVKETPRNVLTRVEVLKDGAQIAYGESGDAGDALLQASLGYLRELPATDEAPDEETE